MRWTVRRRLVGVVLAGVLVAGAVAAGAATTSNARTRGVVLFVGDSNVALGAGEIDWTLTAQDHFDNGYVPVFASRIGATIRTPDCLDATNCTTFNYWKLKLASVSPKVNADAIVNDLGINDTVTPGTATTKGYSNYDQKIDWFMGLVGGRYMFWTNLPCGIEPAERMVGCRAINNALSRATARWPNLNVLAWNVAANTHPEYMESAGTQVHYSRAGQWAWAQFVVDALDARFGAP